MAMTAAANATDRLASAEARMQKAQAGGSQYAIDNAQRRLNIAQRREHESMFVAASAAAMPFLATLKSIVDVMDTAIDKAAKFGTEVMNLKAISGSSGTEAAGALNLFKGAGGRGGPGAIAGMNQKVFSAEGQGALQTLGISVHQGESAISVYMRVTDALHDMADGFYKMRLEQKLGMEDQQEVIRLSHETRVAIAGYSAALGSTAALATVQKFNEAQGLLAVGFDTVIGKIGLDFMQVITPAIETVNQLIGTFFRLDESLGGAGSWVVVIGLLAIGFGAAAAGAVKFIQAIEALKISEKAMIVVQATLNALEGNWATIAAAATISGAAAVGVNALGSGSVGNDPKNDLSDKFGKAVDNFGNSVNQMRDLWSMGGQPKNLSSADAAMLMRQNAMGAIG